MKNFEEIMIEIKSVLMGYKGGKELPHANGTLNWLLKIKPDADDTAKIAAFGHDIERALEKRVWIKIDNLVDNFSKYKQDKRIHAEGGAEAIDGILQKWKVSDEERAMVRNMVANHEDGGNEEADIIRDCDSLSYLSENFDGFLKKYGSNIAKVKVEEMFGRITEARKKLGLELYNKALEKIEKSQIAP